MTRRDVIGCGTGLRGVAGIWRAVTNREGRTGWA